MSMIRAIPVFWKCSSCGSEGTYTTYELDVDESSIHTKIKKRQLEECPDCTNGVEGPLPELAGVTTKELLEAIIAELKKLAERTKNLEDHQEND